jgi:hypothetical protein
MGKSKTFHSKVSKGLMVFVLILLILPITLVFVIEKSVAEAGLLLVLIIPIILFVVHLFFNTQYTITSKGKLEIRSGLYNYRPIDIKSIYRISTSQSLLSSPATSLDRLEINYGKNQRVLVSPQDKGGFVSALKKVNKKIEIVVDGPSVHKF